MSPRLYVVESPEWCATSNDPYEPPDWGIDVLYVFTRSARRAKVLALRAWRRQQPRYTQGAWWNDDPINPYKLMKAYRLEGATDG